MKRNRNSRRDVAGIAGIAIGVAATLFSVAHAQSVSRLGNVDFAVDGDGVHVENVDLGGHYPFGAYMKRVGVPAQATPTLASMTTGGDAGTALGLWRDSQGDARGLAGEASVVRADGRIRTVGDARWRFNAWQGVRAELLGAADLVSSDEGVAYGFVGSRVARKLGDRISVDALAGLQSFTDGNERLHFRAGIVWEALPAYGVNVQWRWRQYESTRDVYASYFNPDAYRQNQVAAGIRTRLGPFDVSAAVGGGVETINARETRPIGTAELRGEAGLTSTLKLALYVGYDRSLTYGDAAGDATRQIGATLTQAF